MITIHGTMNDLVKYVRDRNFPKSAILLLSAKTGLPLGAYAHDGNSKGNVYSRRDIRSQLKAGRVIRPSHSYGGSDNAFNVLINSVKV